MTKGVCSSCHSSLVDSLDGNYNSIRSYAENVSVAVMTPRPQLGQKGYYLDYLAATHYTAASGFRLSQSVRLGPAFSQSFTNTINTVTNNFTSYK